MEVGCGNFHFSCCILLLGRKDERSKINTYVFFHGRKRQFVCKKSAGIQISIFFRGVFVQMEDHAKIETMNWYVVLNQTLQGSDWDKLLRLVTIVT